MRLNCVVITLFWAANCCVAQSSTLPVASPYALSWQLDAPLSVGSMLGIGTSMWLHQHKPQLTEADIAQLQRQDVWTIDRRATYNWSPKAQKTSDFILLGSNALPLILLADPNMRRDTRNIALLTFETYALNFALTNLTKNIVRRKRPFTYNPNVPLSEKTDLDATSSFFSGHVSMTAASTFMTAKIWNDYYPNSPAKPYIWTAAALLPAINAYLRVRGGKHYATDVLVGYIVGAGVGLLVPQLHKIKN